MFCSNCGNKLPDNAKFCDWCGEKIDKGLNISQAVGTQTIQAAKTPYETEKNRKILAIALFCITAAVELIFLWLLCITHLSSAKIFFTYDTGAEISYSSNIWSSSSMAHLADGFMQMLYLSVSGKIWSEYYVWFYSVTIALTVIYLLMGYSLYYKGYRTRMFYASYSGMPLFLSIVRTLAYLTIYFLLSYTIHNIEYCEYINCSGLLAFIILTGAANIASGVLYRKAAVLEYNNKYWEWQYSLQTSQTNS